MDEFRVAKNSLIRYCIFLIWVYNCQGLVRPVYPNTLGKYKFTIHAFEYGEVFCWKLVLDAECLRR